MAKSNNPISQKSESSAYYGDFRGVDFSSDHTQVSENRFAYLVNMYKDYKSKQGGAVETIPGYRSAFYIDEDKFPTEVFRFGGKTFVVVYSKTNDVQWLYMWDNYPHPCGIAQTANVALGKKDENGAFSLDLRQIVEDHGGELGEKGKIQSVEYEDEDGTKISLVPAYVSGTEYSLEYTGLSDGDTVRVTYFESQADRALLYSGRPATKVLSFSQENRRLMFTRGDIMTLREAEEGDGDSAFLGFVFGKLSQEDAFIPTTYKNIPQPKKISITEGNKEREVWTYDGSTGFKQYEHQQINLVSSLYKQEFLPNDEGVQLLPILGGIESSSLVYSVYIQGKVTYTGNKVSDGVKVEPGSTFEDTYLYPRSLSDIDAGLVTFSDAVSIDGTKYLAVKIAHVKVEPGSRFIVTCYRQDGTYQDQKLICSCTVGTVFDNRLFVSGNPEYPNRIWFSKRFGENGFLPLYFGKDDYVDAGASGKVVGMVPVSDKLAVLKFGAEGAGVFLHTRLDTEDPVVPTTYPSERGLEGVQCLGPCANFDDAPVFITKNGLDSLGQVSLSYERALEHRSSLVDAELTSLDLKNAQIFRFGTYLALFVGGKVFLADGRRKYTDSLGVMQYEWFYLEDIGCYQEQYQAYKFASESYATGKEIETKDRKTYPLEIAPESMLDKIANPPDEGGMQTRKVHTASVATEEWGVVDVAYVIFQGDEEETHAYICSDTGLGQIGGTFYPASFACEMDDNICFTAGNNVFLFNFDKRDDRGEIAPKWYTFNGRAIVSGCATKMDNCGIPHLTKSTVKKSMVLKIKSMTASSIKVKVRTNREPYRQISRLNSAVFTFEDVAFDDFSFLLSESGLFSIREKEKKWVEKQIYLYSDEYMRPFSVFYLAYRYTIAGRYKD